MTTTENTERAFQDQVDLERMKAMRLVADHEEGGWFRHADGIVSFHSGAGTITANGLIMESGSTASSEKLRELASDFTDVVAPWAIQVRGSWDPTIRTTAQALGLTDEGQIPTMAMPLEGATISASVPAGFTVEPVEAADADRLAEVTAASFEMEAKGAHGFGSVGLLGDPDVTALWAKNEAGEPVSVGVSVTSSVAAGLFAIATMP